jgi:hypothetical protein
MFESRIDIYAPVWFYDDCSKDDVVLRMTEVLWTDGKFALAHVNGDNIEGPLLFSIEDGAVLNESFFSYYATNDITWLLKDYREKRDELATHISDNAEYDENSIIYDRQRLEALNALLAKHETSI